MDRDGDTEMSASPGLSRSSRSVSVGANPYGYDPELDSDDRSSRDGSISTNYDYDDEAVLMRAPGYRGGGDGMGENLGVANQLHEVDDDSSDSSVRGPTRRVPRYERGNARVQQYDPRISMIFAEHQQSMRGTPENQIGVGLDELEEEVRRVVEPASRHRRMTAYRMMPPRRVDPLRSSRSPSATRVISSSSRTSRPPRQYIRSHG